MRTTFTILLILATNLLFAQFPSMPQMPQTPQPATFPRYDNLGGSAPSPNQNGQVKMGATAEDILRQANRGNPYYRAPGDNRTIQQMNNDTHRI